MPYPRLLRGLPKFGLLIAIAFVLSACGGLSSEPLIVSTAALPTVTPTAPPDLGYPPAKVSLARGAEIFGGPQGCWNCHGLSGQGNGPVVQQNPQNFACKITDFSQPDTARSITIGAWFGLVTNGNNGAQSCLMPPWNARLNEQQRWDVTSYIYSLHYTPALLDQGKALWVDNCQRCHGEQAKGNGPDAKQSARPVPDFSAPVTLITHSDTDLWKTVTNGLGSAMPSFKDKLSDDARWAVVAYLRSLTWDGTGASSAAQATTPTPTATVIVPDGPTINVSGRIATGTAGATLPPSMPLTLRVIELTGSTPRDANKYTTNTSADGSFSFGDIPRQNDFVYVIEVQYAGIKQFSNPLKLQTGSGPKLDLSFGVYEVTTDPSVIIIETQRTFLRPFSQTALQVLEGISFRNTSDKMFLTDRKTAAGDRIGVQFKLPADAQNITLDQSIAQQFVIDQTNGITIEGVIPIAPKGSALLQQSYVLPFSDVRSIVLPTDYSIAEKIVYLLQTSGLTVQESAYVANQPLQLDDGVYNSFLYSKPIRAGEQVTFTVVSQGQQESGRRNVLAAVLFAAVLAGGITGLAIWRLNRRGGTLPLPELPKSADKLVKAIADLDDEFAAGSLSREDYETRRAALKADLARQIDRQGV